MRFLGTTSLFQIRLGWLSVIASLLREGRRLGRQQLEDRLLKTALAREGATQEKWLEQANIGLPQGKMSPRAAPDLVRMAIVYGVYDPDAEALTDLGQVLLALTKWTPDVSPFIWSGAARLIALRLLLGANGDVVFEILRSWGDREQLGPADAPAFLAKCFETLATREDRESEQSELLNQAARANDSGFAERVQREMVYPHFEPMLELGYLSRVRKPGEYRRTPAGQALAEASKGKTADQLLMSGLSRAFLASESIPERGQASAGDLRETLLHLPKHLLGAHAEAPLEPVVLLTQARLLTEKPGRWVDVEQAAALLRDVERASAGRIGLKAGRTPDDQNVTWRDSANLEDAEMWSANGDDQNGRSSKGSLSEPSSDDSSAPPKSPTAPPPAKTPPPPPPKAPPTPSPAKTSSQPRIALTPPSPAKTPSQPPKAPTPPPPAETPSQPPKAPTRPPPPTKTPTPHACLWVSYVERLLTPPVLGDVGGIRRGGPVSWVATLRKLLDVPEDRLKAKRNVADSKERTRHGGHTVASGALLHWLERLGDTVGIDVAPFAECTKLWSGMPDNPNPPIDDLRGALLWAEENSQRMTISLVAVIRAFLEV